MLNGQADSYDNRFNGGWLDQKYHMMSWAYSCLQLRKFYRNVSLVTDKLGYELLIRQLKLPYTDVKVELDRLNHHNPELWSMGKVYSYSLQEKPFIHVDGDAYIWKEFPEKFSNADLVAQHLEHNYLYYRRIMDDLVARNSYIPECVYRVCNAENEINAYNAGVLGGNNMHFFKVYVREVEKFVEENSVPSPGLPMGMLNAYFEQHLFYCIARNMQLKVACITDETDQDALDHLLKATSQFAKAPHHVNYIHLFGGDRKLNAEVCGLLEKLIQADYPEYHRRIIKLGSFSFI
jgi:hypothetical protein